MWLEWENEIYNLDKIAVIRKSDNGQSCKYKRYTIELDDGLSDGVYTLNFNDENSRNVFFNNMYDNL